ncbi:hypothetical protein BGZ61DRAFT_85142 [Ilyonectria robusta]|uniref:uncharacterized protein n=1 Tax=Ilyonectria robusta TaxID=1079257 RepID=UPI001E8DF559|nr:uncharacterized protein BGZ61DRAFT_85142 [Ilyonectria robusta]KAH8735767.1 hypothetical protein BGZ61DRAFT_85142 [Ilyonectria robusta]
MTGILYPFCLLHVCLVIPGCRVGPDRMQGNRSSDYPETARNVLMNPRAIHSTMIVSHIHLSRSMRISGFYGRLISCKTVVDACTPESQLQSGDAKHDGIRKQHLHSAYSSKAIFDEGNMPSISRKSDR